MTSEEIKATDPLALSTVRWLHEIAYQMALSNEKPTPAKQQPAQHPRR